VPAAREKRVWAGAVSECQGGQVRLPQPEDRTAIQEKTMPTHPQHHATAGFETHRSHMMGIAYRMLGSVTDAEDAVQDAWLRWSHVDHDEIADQRAFLTTVVSRISLDRLRKARRSRETYVGPWLPEPVIEETDNAVADAAAPQDLSYALMIALERLSPLERAVFLLHDIFEMDFAEVAAALGRSAPACRQLALRARRHLADEKARFKASAEDGSRIFDAFLSAARSGDLASLRTLLTEDAVLYSDGGGRVQAALRPLFGADHVGRFLHGLVRKGWAVASLWSRRVRVNGMPGRISIEADGVVSVMAVAVRHGRITGIYIQRNPAKLQRLAWLLPGWWPRPALPAPTAAAVG
jgi:RNA polymerase sigma-70 factor, ECF subfamily